MDFQQVREGDPAPLDLGSPKVPDQTGDFVPPFKEKKYKK